MLPFGGPELRTGHGAQLPVLPGLEMCPVLVLVLVSLLVTNNVRGSAAASIPAMGVETGGREPRECTQSGWGLRGSRLQLIQMTRKFE